MASLFDTFSAVTWAIAFAVAFLAGLIKGTVGFGMPMIMISGLGSVMAPEAALAGLLIPTLVSNGWQALRQGVWAALGSMNRFRRFLISGGVVLVFAAQLVPYLPAFALLLLIGVPVSLYAVATLFGGGLRLPPDPGPGVQTGVGVVAGFFGGITGVWGPPTVAMLTAMGTSKTDQMRVQGVIYGLGALALVGAHIASGVLRAETLPLSLSITLPALLGMAAGFRMQDRMDQAMFRRITLFVLLIGGLNLIRKGLGLF